MSALVDTNVLLRRTQPDHAHHVLALESVAKLFRAGETLHFTPQNIAEFWNVATRPVENNGLGFSTMLAGREVEKIERLLVLLPDTPAIYPEWKRLIAKHNVRGVKAHDARLVAAMNVHAVPRILTFNGDDFARFGVQPVHPATILS